MILVFRALLALVTVVSLVGAVGMGVTASAGGIDTVIAAILTLVFVFSLTGLAIVTSIDRLARVLSGEFQAEEEASEEAAKVPAGAAADGG